MRNWKLLALVVIACASATAVVASGGVAARKASKSVTLVWWHNANQGEGHEVHIAHVATARKLLEWARELGVAR